MAMIVLMEGVIVKRKRVHRARTMIIAIAMLVRTRSRTAHQRQGDSGKKHANDRKE
jgi:hypothetical protein